MCQSRKKKAHYGRKSDRFWLSNKSFRNDDTLKDPHLDDNLKEYHLKIIADPVDIKNSRRVILSTGIPETQYSASLSLTKGSKSEILKELSDDGFSKFVLDNIKELEKTSKSME